MCRAPPHTALSQQSLSTEKKTLKMMSERELCCCWTAYIEKSLLWLGESNENKTEKKKGDYMTVNSSPHNKTQ